MINKEKFIIIGDATDKSDEQALEIFKKSGIDTFVIYPNEQDHYGAIERCEKAGLNVFIFGGSRVCDLNKHFFPNAIGDFPNFIEKYNKEKVDLNEYKALKGLYMIDEPGVFFFDKIKELYIPWFNQKYAGKKLWHVNMLPSYSPNELIGINPTGDNGFEEYINRYTDEVLPKVEGEKTLGVDHYPLREKNGVPSLSDTWLYDLAIVGRAAKRAKAIYSVCIQAYCDVDQKKVDCTGDIRFQFYTAMAFGASMFEFYAYSTLHGTIAMLDKEGNPTDIYYSTRDAIREIRTFEKEYLECEWKGVKSYLPKDKTCKAFENVASYLDKTINGVKDVQVSRETLISEFEKQDGKKAYMVVNYGLPVLSSSNIVTITFDKPSKICVYQGGRKDDYGCTDKIDLFLEASQGAFVVIED